MPMNLERELLNRVRTLPSEQQREVVELVNRLQRTRSFPKKGKSLAGLWTKYNIDLSEDDLKKVRTEMWAKFPRAL